MPGKYGEPRCPGSFEDALLGDLHVLQFLNCSWHVGDYVGSVYVLRLQGTQRCFGLNVAGSQNGTNRGGSGFGNPKVE